MHQANVDYRLFLLFSCVQLFATSWTAAHQASLSITNSQSFLELWEVLMPSHQWCHPTISSFVIPFSFCLQSFSASESFPMSQYFASGGQSIGASTSASVLPMNIQGWFPLGLTGLISLQSKELSRVFSNTTVWSIESMMAKSSKSIHLKICLMVLLVCGGMDLVKMQILFIGLGGAWDSAFSTSFWVIDAVGQLEKHEIWTHFQTETC